jgi:hypothetical protein
MLCVMATIRIRFLCVVAIVALCVHPGDSLAQSSITQNSRLFLPSVQAQPAPGVVGYLTENGNPAANQEVTVRFRSNTPLFGSASTEALNVLTDGSGYFKIPGNFGEAGRPSGTYLVVWQNTDNHLARIDHIWAPINNYNPATNAYVQVSVGTIDIASLVPVSPTIGATVSSLPVDFTFTPQRESGDCNLIIINGMQSTSVAAADGASGRITLRELVGFTPGVTYKWRISCRSGYLESVSRNIIFDASVITKPGVSGVLVENGMPVANAYITVDYPYPTYSEYLPSPITARTHTDGSFFIPVESGRGTSKGSFFPRVVWHNDERIPNRVGDIYRFFTNCPGQEGPCTQINVGALETAAVTASAPAQGARVTLPAVFKFKSLWQGPCSLSIDTDYTGQSGGPRLNIGNIEPSGMVTVTSRGDLSPNVLYAWRVECRYSKDMFFNTDEIFARSIERTIIFE